MSGSLTIGTKLLPRHASVKKGAQIPARFSVFQLKWKHPVPLLRQTTKAFANICIGLCCSYRPLPLVCLYIMPVLYFLTWFSLCRCTHLSALHPLPQRELPSHFSLFQLWMLVLQFWLWIFKRSPGSLDNVLIGEFIKNMNSQRIFNSDLDYLTFRVAPVSSFYGFFLRHFSPCCSEVEQNNLQWMQMSLNILILKFTSKLKVKLTTSWQQMEHYFHAQRKT